MPEKRRILDELTMKMVEYDAGDAKRIQHFIKVHKFAAMIARMEALNSEQRMITEAAAIVHDIGIHLCEEKYGACGGKLQEQEGPALAEKMLNSLGFPDNVVERVCFLVGHHHTYDKIDGMDYQILVEADFLVNLYEDELPKENIQKAYEKIFKTGSGRRLCKAMYQL